MKFTSYLTAVLAAAALAGTPMVTLAQAPQVAQVDPNEVGTGAYPATYEEDPTLKDQVVYRPKDLSKVPDGSLGIYAFGNGACSAEATASAHHLLEIASHGYVAIAPGFIPAKHPDRPVMVQGQPGAATRAEQLTEAITWATAENTREGSPYFGKINPQLVAVSGFSCGGIQALNVAHDPRVKSVIVMNSGIFKEPSNIPSMRITKDALLTLRDPVLYVLGGETDIAYGNGMDDFERIAHVPAYVVNIPVGHGGTYMQPHGGVAAEVVVRWLDWQLKGKSENAAYFNGADCTYCKDTRLTIQSKGVQ